MSTPLAGPAAVAHDEAPQVRAGLPVRSSEVLAGLPAGRAHELEVAYGNRDFVRIIDLFGVGGVLKPVGPWEAEDETGHGLILAGSFAASPFGEGYGPLVEFMREYLQRPLPLSLPQQTVSEWRAAVETNLIALLSAVSPSHADSRVLFSNSGAEAIEAAVKLARAARPRATTFVNFTHGYHGKTFAALSLTPNESYQAVFRPLMGPVRTIPYGDAAALDLALREIGPDKVTAIVLEPVQGEAGIVVPPDGYLREVGEIARRHGILVIADEIQTGLGRTGHWFAGAAAGLDADIITLAKPLGGGLIPVGATIVRHDVFLKMQGGTNGKRHSNTFGGGSLAMAVALRSLEIIHDEGLVEKAREDGAYGLARLRAMQEAHPGFIESVRGAGMLFGIQVRPVAPPRFMPLDPELLPILTSLLFMRALHQGGVHACFAQNSLRVVRFTPALTMPRPVLSKMFDRIERVLETHKQPWRMLMTMPAKKLAQLARIAL